MDPDLFSVTSITPYKMSEWLHIGPGRDRTQSIVDLQNGCFQSHVNQWSAWTLDCKKPQNYRGLKKFLPKIPWYNFSASYCILKLFHNGFGQCIQFGLFLTYWLWLKVTVQSKWCTMLSSHVLPFLEKQLMCKDEEQWGIVTPQPEGIGPFSAPRGTAGPPEGLELCSTDLNFTMINSITW